MNMTRRELKELDDREIAGLLDRQPTAYAREVIIDLLSSGRFYDRAVLHAALKLCKRPNGTRVFVTINNHLADGIIDPKAVRFIGRGWHAETPRRRSCEQKKRGKDLRFSVKGSEIKRIILEDGLCPKLRTSAKGLV